jgi:nucleotide-binding universal stress UspA family protein
MKLLLCTDGSEQAERAIKLSLAITRGCKAAATVLGIVEHPGQSKVLLDALKRAQTMFEGQGVNAELITKSGKPVEEIVRRTEEVKYDLVVIGAVHKESRGAFWMSSKSYKIIKEIKPPVLSVAGERTTVKRIVICCGGKHYIDSAVRLAGELARCFGASATLLHVMPELPAIYAHLPRMEETTTFILKSQSELGINLRHGQEILSAAGVPAEVRLRSGSVLEEILREIHEGDYDLVVTGSALSRSWRTYVLGDISREIVNRVQRAVLVVRSQELPLEPWFALGRFWGTRRSDTAAHFQ